MSKYGNSMFNSVKSGISFATYLPDTLIKQIANGITIADITLRLKVYLSHTFITTYETYLWCESIFSHKVRTSTIHVSTIVMISHSNCLCLLIQCFVIVRLFSFRYLGVTEFTKFRLSWLRPHYQHYISQC